MKKSKQIQLVLITAALASCNRQLVPQVSGLPVTADSTLTAPPPYGSDTACGTFNECCQEVYSQLWNYSFNPLGTYYYPGAPLGTWYYPGVLYRKGAFWRNKHFVVRGGWGKSASAGS